MGRGAACVRPWASNGTGRGSGFHRNPASESGPAQALVVGAGAVRDRLWWKRHRRRPTADAALQAGIRSARSAAEENRAYALVQGGTELRLCRAPRGPTHIAAQLRIAGKPQHVRQRGLVVVVIKQKSILAVRDQFGKADLARTHHREPACHRLGDDTAGGLEPARARAIEETIKRTQKRRRVRRTGRQQLIASSARDGGKWRIRIVPPMRRTDMPAAEQAAKQLRVEGMELEQVIPAETADGEWPRADRRLPSGAKRARSTGEG